MPNRFESMEAQAELLDHIDDLIRKLSYGYGLRIGRWRIIYDDGIYWWWLPNWRPRSWTIGLSGGEVCQCWGFGQITIRRWPR